MVKKKAVGVEMFAGRDVFLGRHESLLPVVLLRYIGPLKECVLSYKRFSF